MVGDARLVLLGEASHGTHDFHRERAEITKRLIVERGFTAVAAEADWRAAFRVNCYARRAQELVRQDGSIAEDELLFAERNANVVKHAEQCYRSMFRSGAVVITRRSRILGVPDERGYASDKDRSAR